MNTVIEINEPALEGYIGSMTELVSDEVRSTLHKGLRHLLQHAPVRITAFDPVTGTGEPRVETVTKRELCALFALMNYAAWHQNLRPETVRAWLEDQCGVPHVALIPRTMFQRAVDLLMDMHAYVEEDTPVHVQRA